MSYPLPCIEIHNATFEAAILLQGAQLMHFAPHGQAPWIFANAQTPFTPRAEIYGGVPLVFPWFNRLKEHLDAPNHGFARQAQWTVETQADELVSLSLSSQDVREQGFATSVWQGEFFARMVFEFGDKLGLRFEVMNRGDFSFGFECAMHPYFAVSDVRQTQVVGVPDGVWLGDEKRVAPGGTLGLPPFGARLFEASSGPVSIREPKRTFTIKNREGWRSSVVWNPGQAMEDLNENDWRHFVCVETAALRSDAVSLSAGESYALDIVIELN